MKRLRLLTAGTLLFWGVLVYPGVLLFGNSALAHSLAALGLCLIPALVTLAWTSRGLQSSPEQQLVAVLGGTGVRMAVALGGGLGLQAFQPELFTDLFWGWLAAFYFFTLAFEIVLLVARPQVRRTGL
jgi:hypothetical protein